MVKLSTFFISYNWSFGRSDIDMVLWRHDLLSTYAYVVLYAQQSKNLERYKLSNRQLFLHKNHIDY